MSKNLQMLLNLKNDVVFKMFFAREKNKPLLVSFLECILEPQSPIEDVELLNPALNIEVVGDKASILDLVIKLKDNSRIDVEMQMASTESYRKRILYYWAKLHQGQLQVGDTYQNLAPTISISVLGYNEFPENIDEIHSIFELRERDRGILYIPDLQLHFLELPKYKSWRAKNHQQYKLLDYWTRFFQITESTDEHIQEDMRKEPIMSKALQALEDLSMEPSARELAEIREKSLMNLRSLTVDAETRGIALGEARGEARGEAVGKSKMIRKAAQSGMTAEQIATLFELPIEEVKATLQD